MSTRRSPTSPLANPSPSPRRQRTGAASSTLTEMHAKLHAAHVEHVRAAYAAALERAGLDGVLVHSGALIAKTKFDDQDWPLRPTPHFQHWLALTEPDCYLLVVPGRKPTLLRPRT